MNLLILINNLIEDHEKFDIHLKNNEIIHVEDWGVWSVWEYDDYFSLKHKTEGAPGAVGIIHNYEIPYNGIAYINWKYPE